MVFSEIISSVMSGGVTGLLGAIISRYADYKTKQLDKEIKMIDHDHEINLRHADARIMEMEWEGRERVALVESDAKMDIAETQAFQASLLSEPKQYANTSKLTRAQNAWMVFIDGVRGLIRPGLTLYLCGITTVVYLQAGSIIKNQPIPIESAIDIYTQISSTILYLTTTSVLFWFGTRSKDRTRK